MDVYSFAMIFYNMLTGEPPFANLDGLKAAWDAAVERDRPPIPRNIDEALARLCKSAWADDPRARPSFKAVLEILNRHHLSVFKVSFEDTVASNLKPDRTTSTQSIADGGGCCSVM